MKSLRTKTILALPRPIEIAREYRCTGRVMYKNDRELLQHTQYIWKKGKGAPTG